MIIVVEMIGMIIIIILFVGKIHTMKMVVEMKEVYAETMLIDLPHIRLTEAVTNIEILGIEAAEIYPALHNTPL